MNVSAIISLIKSLLLGVGALFIRKSGVDAQKKKELEGDVKAAKKAKNVVNNLDDDDRKRLRNKYRR